ncbi:MAG: PAS domain S-box protein [Candidatus Thorarchaeota archaeon]|nr:MAG: PAS domain S-box protein [Candidatus Thorarchaeota archaeon]
MTGEPDASSWLEKVFDVVHEGVILLQDEDIVLANTAFAEMVNYSEKELLDMAFEDLVDTLSRRHDRAMLDAIASGENIERFNTRLRSKNGDTIHVEINPTEFVYYDEPAVLASVKDISRQLALEEQVTELEKRFATLYDMSPIAYITLNRAGEIEQVNQATEELMGCGAEEILGKTLADFLPDPNSEYDPGADIISEVLRGKSVTGLEIEFKRPDERLIWVSISSRALAIGAERAKEIGLMAFDVTRRRAAEQRLREESERANLYLEAMTSDLNLIYQNTLLSLEDLKTSLKMAEREASLMQETSWNLRRASRLIANLGVLMSLGHEAPARGKTDLYPHIGKAIREADRDFEWKTLKAESNVADDAFEVAGHAFLWNIFFNIIHNSMSYVEGNEVEIDVNAEPIESGDKIRIEISDRGPGISDDQKELIFDWTGRRAAGRGLGLAVVDHFVSDLDGRIWVEDRIAGKPQEGSKFVIILPAWKEALDIPSIVFYKSDHCVFCTPVLDSLLSVLDELGIPRSVIDLVNIDDPEAEISEDDLPALPTIQMGADELTGFVTEDDLRDSLMRLIMFAGG